MIQYSEKQFFKIVPLKAMLKDKPTSLGQKIREARRSRRASIHEISRATGLSPTFLSRLETSKTNVSVDNLRKIADSLDVTMVQLFEENDSPSKGLITRKGQGAKLKINQSTAYSESLIRKSNSNIQATLFINPPGEGRKVPFSHNGEEIVYIIKGSVLFSLDDQKHTLKAGDSMYYRSELPHSWVNIGKRESVLLIFNSPQVW